VVTCPESLRSNILNPAKAWVFVRPPGGWAGATVSPSAVLAASDEDGQKYSTFGQSVAVTNDAIFIAATGHGANPSHSPPLLDHSAGSVYVFTRPAGGWVDEIESAVLSPSTGLGTYMGVRLSTDGATLVATSNYGNAVYVFSRPSNGWTTSTETAVLSAPLSKCLVNGDAAVVGNEIVASVCPTNYGDQDAVYVFTKGSGAWTSAANPTVKLTSQVPYGMQGGDINFDGSTIALGGGTGISIFKRPAGGWAPGGESQILTDPDPNYYLGGFAMGSGAIVTSEVVGAGGAGERLLVFEVPVVRGLLTVAPKPVVVGSGAAVFTGTCGITFGLVKSCSVVAKAGSKVVASGSVVPSSAAVSVRVPLSVNATGRSLLKAGGGVLPIVVTATVSPATGSAVTVSAPDSLVAKKVSITLASSVLFSSGSSVLTTAAVGLIRAFGVKVQGSKSAVCDGFTDNQGSAAFNLKLGLARATAVCTILKKYVGSTVVHSFGASKPIASNATAAGRAKNRRVTITIAN
jgi:outer membrane protein OmpA-like peptidoglycan-associated protein